MQKAAGLGLLFIVVFAAVIYGCNYKRMSIINGSGGGKGLYLLTPAEQSRRCLQYILDQILSQTVGPLQLGVIVGLIPAPREPNKWLVLARVYKVKEIFSQAQICYVSGALSEYYGLAIDIAAGLRGKGWQVNVEACPSSDMNSEQPGYVSSAAPNNALVST